jgi:phospholipase/lecithinase/hemolysin
MDYYKELKDNKLFCMIDHDNVFDVENIYNITVKNNWFNKDKIHPGNQAHTMWADIISTHLLKKYHAENS